MCLLIASPEGRIPSANLVEDASWSNPHGFGVAFPIGGKVVVKKWVDLPTEKQIRVLEKLSKNGPYIAHWRLATSGEISKEMAHPFKISEKCAMAHNGVINVETTKRESDTAILASCIIEAGIEDAEELILALHDIKDVLGNSKIASINDEGKIFIFNEEFGKWVDGIWYSNKRLLQPSPIIKIGFRSVWPIY